MNITTPEAGKAGGNQAQVGTDIRNAPKHNARTTQATTPQAVPNAEARSQPKAHSQRQDSGIQLQISGKKGAKAQQALTQIAQQNNSTNGSAVGDSETNKTNATQTAAAETKKSSTTVDSEQLNEVLKKLEDEERERKERAEALQSSRNNFTDTSPGSTPEETIQKARILRSKALTTSQSDPEGAKIAAQAAQMESEAKAKITERQREAAGIAFDPVDLMERTPKDSRDSKILEKIGSTYGLTDSYDPSRLVSEFA